MSVMRAVYLGTTNKYAGVVMEPAVSIVLGTYNRLKFLKIAIESIRREVAGHAHEIIVVDGGSFDGTVEWLTKQKDLVTIVQHNRGLWQGKAIDRRSWGYFMNLAFKCARGKYVCMLSDDCLVVPGAIINGVNIFEKCLSRNEKIGAVAFYWRNWPENDVYFIGLTLGGNMFVNHGLFLRQALEDVGFIDEDTYRFYHADGDLCLKMRQMNYACIASPGSFIEHYSHANTAARKSNTVASENDWGNYLKKWEGIFYFKDSTDIEGCIEQEYSDVTNTGELFRSAESVRYKLAKLRKKIRMKIAGVCNDAG